MIETPVLHVLGSDQLLRSPETAPPKIFVHAEPCIKVGFFFDRRVSEGQTKEISYDPVIALVDTGADGVYVHPGLIEKYQCPVAVGGDELTVNGQTGSRGHRGSIFLIESRRVIDLYVIARDFRAEGKPFDIVLGRRFLQFCHLTWDGPRQSVRLNLVENANAF